jgi:UDP-N-acetylmuramyl pentapeptide phosphotransferase/UDP-N-acetylglucosamine-1-phosphate transferase
MDGMDGQAALFGALVSLAMAMPLVAFDFPYAVAQSVVLLVLAGVLFAFLMFNLPTTELPRKTFMGDSGSQFVGFVLAIAALHTCEYRNSSFPFAAALIILSPFLWDVLYTLIRRTIRGENLLQAHRTHLYQRLLVAGWTHGRTLALNFVLWSLCFVLAQLDARFWRSSSHYLRPLVWLAVLLVHAGYTLFVLFEERKVRRQQCV